MPVKRLRAITVNSGGNLTIHNTSNTVIMSSDVTVSSGGTLTHNVNYVSSKLSANKWQP